MLREPERCAWAGNDPLMIRYHDREWGVPVHRDRKLFEMLLLEGAQAGLSWRTILAKRANYRRAFDGFDFRKVARYGEARLRKLLADDGLVRNRLKLQAAVENARAFLAVRREFRTFDRYLFGFVEGRPVRNRWSSLSQVPARTPLADTVSRDLQDRGFRFVGPTIVYAFLQAVGVVNDHTTNCFRWKEIR